MRIWYAFIYQVDNTGTDPYLKTYYGGETPSAAFALLSWLTSMGYCRQDDQLHTSHLLHWTATSWFPIHPASLQQSTGPEHEEKKTLSTSWTPNRKGWMTPNLASNIIGLLILEPMDCESILHFRDKSHFKNIKSHCSINFRENW